MLTITAANVIEYIQDNTDIFTSPTLYIEDLSGFNPEEEQEGFVNYIFRVYDGEKSVILKQARGYLKYFGEDFVLDPFRNQIEYQTLKLRGAIVPEYVPQIHYIDKANNIFIMEDLSNLDIMRFQLIKRQYFPNFAKQIGKYMARSNFYTSELFLDGKTHRRLQAAFLNSDMRSLMGNVAFVRGDLSGIDNNTEKKWLLSISNNVWDNEDLVLECYKMRDIFMKRGECLIHGDLHTSNIFISPREMKVIDMEYTFMGPFSFDMGYLLANFISQFCAYTFRPDIPGEEREEYCTYLLNTIRDVYAWYVYYFNKCWDKDVKEGYRNVKGYRQALLGTFLPEVVGFAACANMMRIISLAGYPDYDAIEDGLARGHAQCLSIAIDQYLLFKRNEITAIDELTDILTGVRAHYLRCLY